METTVSSKTLHQGKHFSFKTDKVQLENGKQTTRDIIEHPGAVAIIPIDKDEIILCEQYRYAPKKNLLEIPAGTLEKDEDPYACAVRELREETGYAAKDWKKLLQCYMAPGYSDEIIHFYVAEDLTYLGTEQEEDENIQVKRLGFNEVLDLIESNVIEDSKTITGVLSFFTRASL